jgi:hypothetical protein
MERLITSAAEVMFTEYSLPVGMVLIAIGVALVCVGLISRRRAKTDPPEPEDTGELRTFVDSLRRTDDATEEEYVRPRIDRLRKEHPSNG